MRCWLRQVVGLKGLLHTGVVLSGKTKLHGVRLAQGSEIKLELRAATSALASGCCCAVAHLPHTLRCP